MIGRYIGLFVCTALAGILSSFLWPVPNGFMAGALGMSLAAGALWLGRQQQRQQGKLGGGQIVLTGLACGLVAGLAMGFIAQGCAGIRPKGEAAMFGPPVLPFWVPLLMGVFYGVVVQWGYASRLYSAHPFGTALSNTCLGCFALKAMATLLFAFAFEKGSDPVGAIIGSVVLSLLGAVPFALLWVLSMRWLDPAWAAAAPTVKLEQPARRLQPE